MPTEEPIVESMEVLDQEVYLQSLRGEVTQIVAFLEQAVETRSAVHEVERELWGRMLALGPVNNHANQR